jgi:flagellar hook assembly protein FlgD
MTTRFDQLENQKQGIRRRASSRGLSFGPIATAITIGTVAVLLGVTFIGDWLRTPKVAAEASPSIISPNGDQTQDLTNFSYTLNEDADVTVAVFNESGTQVRTITNNQFQTRGQHIATWDGRDNIGQVVPDGRYQMDVTAQGTVRAGNQGANVEVDTVPPALHLVNMDEANRVRDANLTIEGLTDLDAVVQLEGDPQLIPIDSDGHFSIKRQLVEGSNLLQIAATDPAGNKATISREIILVTQPPEVTITSPLNDQWINQPVLSVAGVVPPGTTLKVNGQEAVVANEGQFEREVILQEGDNTLKIEATDDVGNVTTQEMIVHRKTTIPVLELNVEDGATFQQSEVQLMGKTEPGALLQVNGQAVTVSSLGEFQTTVTLLDGENTIEAIVQDQAGNINQLQRRLNYRVAPPESELARVARNLPALSTYTVPVLISLPVLLILAYFLTRPVALVVSSESSNFRPGLPDEGRFLRLSIDLTKAARTTVEIKDKRGNTIATLLHRRHRNGGHHTLHWDGYDDFGRIVPPGDYVIQASASTTGGTVTGTLNITVLEDRAVHRQYLKNSPSYQDDSRVSVGQNGEYAHQSQPTTRRSRRR